MRLGLKYQFSDTSAELYWPFMCGSKEVGGGGQVVLDPSGKSEVSLEILVRTSSRC